MFLVRKISRAKWEPKEGLSAEEISADAVTVDLRTRDNSLSFWKCKSDSDKSVEDVALAIASKAQCVEKVDLVWVADGKLRDDGQILKDTDGETYVEDLVKKHVDVCMLDYVRLGKVARLVAAAIKANQYRRLTKRRIAQLLATAVEQGRINFDDLEEGVKTKVQNLLVKDSS